MLRLALLAAPLFTFLISLSTAAATSCEDRLSQHSQAAQKIVRAYQLAVRPPRFEDLSTEALLEYMFVLTEGLRTGSIPSLTYAEAQEVAKILEISLPENDEFRLNVKWSRNTWFKENILNQTRTVLIHLGTRLAQSSLPWADRAGLFRHFINDPRLPGNAHISVYVLDPLLGIDSMAFAQAEQALTETRDKDDPIDGQRKFLGFNPENVWSHYSWLKSLFDFGKIRPGDLVVDIGSGIGRTGLFVAAMYPEAKFQGLEIVDARVAAAQAIVMRFNLQDRVQFRKVNLAEEDLPLSDHYYFFNALSEQPYRRILSTLRKYAKSRPFYLYTAFDEFGRFAQQPWLLQRGRHLGRSLGLNTDPVTGEITVFPVNWPMIAYKTKRTR